jgi:hypothetical protein
MPRKKASTRTTSCIGLSFPEMAFIAISLGVVWINRMCNPANPAFTMSEILRRQADAWVRDRSSSKLICPSFRMSRVWFRFEQRLACCAVARGSKPAFALSGYGVVTFPRFAREGEWSRSGSNRRPEACKATALPTELRPRIGIRSIAGWLAEP